MAGSSAALLVVLSVIGYALLRHACYRTHHRWQALEWQQNIFEATTTGLLFFALSRIATPVLGCLPGGVGRSTSALAAFLQSRLPLPHAGSVLGAVIIGLLCALLVNLRWRNNAALDLALAHHGGSLRSFLNSARLQGRAVMLTLDSRKVYVGSVFSAPSLHREAQVVMFPTLSGYRRTEDLEVRWRTNYAPVYLDLLERRKKGERLETGPEHFQLVIPLSTVVSATYFDKKIYDQHFSSKD